MQQDNSLVEEDMADTRKRRLTTPGSPGRRGSPVQAASSSSTATIVSANLAEETRGDRSIPSQGMSHESTIDRTTSGSERSLPPTPPAPRPPAPDVRRTSRPEVPTTSSTLVTGRRQSDIVLPKWQPDSDVLYCPVCKNNFTFWYRKHHCRKCGRVVCANCSPHRITIPRQFIVRQPEPSIGVFIDLTGDTSPSTSNSTPQIWGGEEVRVCNPCVPDPNLSPPPQGQTSLGLIPTDRWRLPTDSSTVRDLQQSPRRPRNASVPHPPVSPHHSFAGHRSTLSDAAFPGNAGRQSVHDPFGSHRGAFANASSLRDLYSPAPRSSSLPYPPRTSSNSFFPQFRPSAGSFGPLVPSDRPAYIPAPAPIPAPRRQIAEEDECPVCGEELPPVSSEGSTTDREAHVQDCINSHLYTPSTPPVTSQTTSAPIDTAGIATSNPGGESSSSFASTSTSVLSTHSNPPTSGSAVASSSMPRAAALLRQRRMTGGRMLVYRATEKDCLDEDGSAAECVICFEEFEEGDEMGRLECLCRFHRTCIRQWWETKGAGSCPTHQLHD